MQERLVFTMNVCNEMLRAFRQIENSLQVNYLRACLRDVRERLGKQLQVFYIVGCKFMVFSHIVVFVLWGTI